MIELLFVFVTIPVIGWIGFGIVVFLFTLYDTFTLVRRGRLARGIGVFLALPAAGGLLALAAPHAVQLGSNAICCAHPTDDTLIRRFATHRNDFERLVRMSDADPDVIRIAPTFTRLKNDWGWPRADSLLGFSPERWREYRQLFFALHLRKGLERGDGPHSAIYFLASARGMATGGSTKGYAYSLSPLVPTYPSLDSVPPDLPSNVTGYRHLSGPWYLFYSWDD